MQPRRPQDRHRVNRRLQHPAALRECHHGREEYGELRIDSYMGAGVCLRREKDLSTRQGVVLSTCAPLALINNFAVLVRSHVQEHVRTGLKAAFQPNRLPANPCTQWKVLQRAPHLLAIHINRAVDNGRQPAAKV